MYITYFYRAVVMAIFSGVNSLTTVRAYYIL